MEYVIGVDEAGYGPNLGPLVISAVAWEVPNGVAADSLYKRLADVIVAARGAACDGGPIAIADSKALYQPGTGVAGLERGVLAALGALGAVPNSAAELWEALTGGEPARGELPWHDDDGWPVPIAVTAEARRHDATFFSQGIERAGVRIAAIRSRGVFPGPFNALVDRFGTKGAALTHTTLELVAQVCAALSPGRVSICCDKHGGRDRYLAALQAAFDLDQVQVVCEGRGESCYRWGRGQQSIECRFRVGGEELLPTALASMTSKYLREVAMRSFNDYWRKHVPDLRPTAGYPVDARRFWDDIAVAQKKLGIADRLLWRER